MTTDEIGVRILIYNDYGTEKFLNVFFPLKRGQVRMLIVGAPNTPLWIVQSEYVVTASPL